MSVVNFSIDKNISDSNNVVWPNSVCIFYRQSEEAAYISDKHLDTWSIYQSYKMMMYHCIIFSNGRSSSSYFLFLISQNLDSGLLLVLINHYLSKEFLINLQMRSTCILTICFWAYKPEGCVWQVAEAVQSLVLFFPLGELAPGKGVLHAIGYFPPVRSPAGDHKL